MTTAHSLLISCRRPGIHHCDQCRPEPAIRAQMAAARSIRALLELAEAARGAWGVLLGVIYEGNGGKNDDTADPSQVIQVLDSPALAPIFRRKIDAILRLIWPPAGRAPGIARTNPWYLPRAHRSMGSRLDRLRQFLRAFRSSRRNDRTYPRTVVLPGLWQTKGEPVPVPRRQPPRRLVRRQPSIDDPHRDSPRR